MINADVGTILVLWSGLCETKESVIAPAGGPSISANRVLETKSIVILAPHIGLLCTISSKRSGHTCRSLPGTRSVNGQVPVHTVVSKDN
jgi:hypothetical protein